MIVDIVFTRSKKRLPLVSWFIMLWTKQKYSHVAVGLNMFSDTKLYYHANETKVNVESEYWFNKKHEIIKTYKIDISDFVCYNIINDLSKDLGMNYGIWQNLGIVIVDIFKFFGIHIRNPWRKGVNCSEILYVHFFRNLDKNYDKDTIKPHHIERLIQNYGSNF